MMMKWKGFGSKQSWPNYKALSWHLSGRTEEKHKKPQSGYPVSRLRLEPGTSQIQSRSVNHLTTTFSIKKN
jgi:hypothetical protein